MRKFIGTLIFATLIVSPSFADKCVVVVPVGPGWNSEAIHNHELAHCNGWTHGHNKQSVAPFGYQGQVPPKRFVRPYAGEFEALFETPSEARKLCKAANGHASRGCQWFER